MTGAGPQLELRPLRSHSKGSKADAGWLETQALRAACLPCRCITARPSRHSVRLQLQRRSLAPQHVSRSVDHLDAPPFLFDACLFGPWIHHVSAAGHDFSGDTIRRLCHSRANALPAALPGANLGASEKSCRCLPVGLRRWRRSVLMVSQCTCQPNRVPTDVRDQSCAKVAADQFTALCRPPGQLEATAAPPGYLVRQPPST